MKKLIYVFVFLLACSRQKQNSERVRSFNCENDFHETVLYELSNSLNNFHAELNESAYSKEEIINYCLLVNSGCGATIFYDLEKLTLQDSVRFCSLRSEFNLNSIDSFAGYMSSPPEEYEKKTEKLIGELLELCDCHSY